MDADVELRCDGNRKDGSPCNKLLAIASRDFAGHVTAKCPNCNNVMRFTRPRVQAIPVHA